jgi:hypothetical protein
VIWPNPSGQWGSSSGQYITGALQTIIIITTTIVTTIKLIRVDSIRVESIHTDHHVDEGQSPTSTDDRHPTYQRSGPDHSVTAMPLDVQWQWLPTPRVHLMDVAPNSPSQVIDQERVVDDDGVVFKRRTGKNSRSVVRCLTTSTPQAQHNHNNHTTTTQPPHHHNTPHSSHTVVGCLVFVASCGFCHVVSHAFSEGLWPPFLLNAWLVYYNYTNSNAHSTNRTIIQWVKHYQWYEQV